MDNFNIPIVGLATVQCIQQLIHQSNASDDDDDDDDDQFICLSLNKIIR